MSADQKQQCVSVWEELCQIATDDATMLSRAGFMVMTLRKSSNPPNGKIQTHQEHAHHFLLHQEDCLQIIHCGRPNNEFRTLL
jgi:hypothetical protein